MELFILVFGALLSITNPLGTVPIFVALTEQHSTAERSRIAFRAALNVMLILVLAFLFGTYLLPFFGISIASLKIAGGLIISSSGFALLTGSFSEHKGMKRSRVKHDVQTRDEISLTPLAIPMIAGPGAISLLITYNQKYGSWLDVSIILVAIVVVSAVIYTVLKSSHYIARSLGASGINALSRVIGFIVIAIGIEFILSTSFELLKGALSGA